MCKRLAVLLPFVLTIAAIVATPLVARGSAGPVDPRTGGLEIVMGEWTLVPEAKAIRPGAVTFVITNRGRFGHGFRIRGADGAGDWVGKDRFEARTRVLGAGESTKLTVDLKAGVYDIECFVEDVHGDHEQRGMRSTLEVRSDAPFVKPKPAAGLNVVRIEAFKYLPTPVSVKPGTTVKWINEDAARHTVSALNGSFTSKELTKGQTYSRRFPRTGTFAYLCAVHPTMKAKLVVKR